MVSEDTIITMAIFTKDSLARANGMGMAEIYKEISIISGSGINGKSMDKERWLRMMELS